MSARSLAIASHIFALFVGTYGAPDIKSVKTDLKLPALQTGEASAGKRVKQTHPNWDTTDVYHLLHLPNNWKPGASYPVIVEYAGNGPYKNHHGDKSSGHPEGSKMGYGLSEGNDYIWLCLPYLSDNGQKNVTRWWGNQPSHDPSHTLDYAKKAVPWVCENFGGNAEKVFLCGFSRGAVACNFIGLHDNEIAKLWCAFLPYSHYDGVKNWSYPNSDTLSAISRLKRLQGRPQFITHENNSVDATKKWIQKTGIKGDFTFRSTGFRNHNDAWLLRPSPVRKEMRTWMKKITNTSN